MIDQLIDQEEDAVDTDYFAKDNNTESASQASDDLNAFDLLRQYAQSIRPSEMQNAAVRIGAAILPPLQILEGMFSRPGNAPQPEDQIGAAPATSNGAHRDRSADRQKPGGDNVAGNPAQGIAADHRSGTGPKSKPEGKAGTAEPAHGHVEDSGATIKIRDGGQRQVERQLPVGQRFDDKASQEALRQNCDGALRTLMAGEMSDAALGQFVLRCRATDPENGVERAAEIINQWAARNNRDVAAYPNPRGSLQLRIGNRFYRPEGR